MYFSVLGNLTVVDAGASCVLGTPKARTLLALLLCRAGDAVPVDTLADALWSGRPPKSAVKNIQTYVHQLRRGLGASERIIWSGCGYRVDVRPGELDAASFERLAGHGRSAVGAGDFEQAGRLLREALDLWQGAPFADIVDAPLVNAAADRLSELRWSVRELLFDADLALGRHAELITELAAFTAEQPLREKAWAQLMLALYRCGRQADALDAYVRSRATLAKETGVEPGRELRDLHRAILSQDRCLDLSPARTRPTVNVPQMLPPDIGDFTGRRAELATIRKASCRAMRNRPKVLAVVSGRGGIGKTALAVHAAHDLRTRYPDGQLFACLAGTQRAAADPHEVLGRFLRALGVANGAVPDDAEERIALYRSLLAKSRILVVLDDAADEAQIAPLLPGSGTCSVIVTSRMRLGGVPCADLIDLGVLSDVDGETLLTKIIGGTRLEADRTVVRDLLPLCSGLPLALRIAGSQLAARPHWSVSDLVDRLADTRHRLDRLRYRDLEIRASLALSYQALTAPAQRLFRLLGLMETCDFALWTATALLDATPTTARELLDELIDVRLVDVVSGSSPRYAFHDLTRLYARERAEAEEPQNTRRAAEVRAFGALLSLTEIVHRADEGGDYTMIRGAAVRWRPDVVRRTLPPVDTPMAWLRPERLSLVTAVRQAAELGLHELCWELALGGNQLFQAMCYFEEWEQTHTQALTVTEAAGDLRGQAMMHMSLWSLYYARRRFDMAGLHNARALRLFERLGDRYGQALALRKSAQLDIAAGRLAEARANGRQAHRLLGEIDTVASADALAQVGVAYLEGGEPAAAADVLARVVRTAQDLHSRILSIRDSYWLGQAYLALGRDAQAEMAFSTVWRLADASDDRIGQVYGAHARGCLHRARGEYGAARRALTGGLEMSRHIGDRLMQLRILCDLIDVAIEDGDDSGAAPVLAEDAATLNRKLDYAPLRPRVLRQARLLRSAVPLAPDDGHPPASIQR